MYYHIDSVSLPMDIFQYFAHYCKCLQQMILAGSYMIERTFPVVEALFTLEVTKGVMLVP